MRSILTDYYSNNGFRLILADALEGLKTLDSGSVQCVVTSPPYWGLRDYGVKGQIGLEKHFHDYVLKMVDIFNEVSRVLRDDGVVWMNLGDTYSSNNGGDKLSGKNKTNKGCAGNSYRTPGKLGMKRKELLGIPWRIAFALQESGYYLRQDIIWSKPSPMPESVKDRCTKSHEYIFLLTKKAKYYFDSEAIKEQAQWMIDNQNRGTGVGFGYGSDADERNRPRIKKIPAGWDSGPGGHDKKEGRYNNSAYSFSRKTAEEGKPGSPKQHREDREDIKYSGTRNKRSVWTVEDHNSLIQWLSTAYPDLLDEYLKTIPDVWGISSKPFKEAHFATFPPELPKICIKASTRERDIVLDPFNGSGTTGLVARELGRNYIGIDINPKYLDMTINRVEHTLNQVTIFDEVNLD